MINASSRRFLGKRLSERAGAFFLWRCEERPINHYSGGLRKWRAETLPLIHCGLFLKLFEAMQFVFNEGFPRLRLLGDPSPFLHP